jgi:hypothetical protein
MGTQVPLSKYLVSDDVLQEVQFVIVIEQVKQVGIHGSHWLPLGTSGDRHCAVQ